MRQICIPLAPSPDGGIGGGKKGAQIRSDQKENLLNCGISGISCDEVISYVNYKKKNASLKFRKCLKNIRDEISAREI